MRVEFEVLLAQMVNNQVITRIGIVEAHAGLGLYWTTKQLMAITILVIIWLLTICESKTLSSTRWSDSGEQM